MSKGKKTVYLSVIGIGVIALAIDLLSGDGTGAPATASAAISPQTAANIPTGSASAIDTITVSVMPFPNDIPGITPSRDWRDPFMISPKAMEKLTPATPTPRELEAQIKDGNSYKESFCSSHTLSAVLQMDGSPIAVIDGTIVSEGHIISGCKLIKIEEKAAIFDCNGIQITLQLQKPY